MNDYIIAAAAGAENHGDYVSAISHLATAWREGGFITAAQRAQMMEIAAQFTRAPPVFRSPRRLIAHPSRL